MIPFEYFEHTADTLFRGYGKNFEEALSNLILAAYNVIVDTKTLAEEKEFAFTKTAKKKETLIYDILEELIFLIDTESFLGKKAKVGIVETKDEISASIILKGDTAKPIYDVFGQIKSATYSQMEIGKCKVDGEEVIYVQAVLDL